MGCVLQFYHRLIILLLLVPWCTATFAQQKKTQRLKPDATLARPPFAYLALGDSYTIGEGVALQQTYPYQTVALLRENGIAVAAPEIVATTGWTTNELSDAMRRHRFLPRYGLVTLLIGVNNQYRGRSLYDYEQEFKDLLQKALALAANEKTRVVVLAIPDYGVTPFARDKNPEKIGHELDAFNDAAKSICAEAGVYFLDISTSFRKAANDPELIAQDGLHPSEKAYREWAEGLAAAVLQHLP